MKKIYSLLIALLCSATMTFAYDAEIDGLYYDLDHVNKTASTTTVFDTIFDDYGEEVVTFVPILYRQEEIIIPAKIVCNNIEYDVTSIGMGTFFFGEFIKSIKIPNSVTSIGDIAFAACCGLTLIEIPNSVTSIGGNLFGEMYGDESLVAPYFKNLPDGCVYINNCLYAYKGGMPNGTHIVVKEGTTQICSGAFSGCIGLTSIEIPNSVTLIGENTFSGCTGLTSIEIPNGVTSIGSSAFEGCSSLTLITIPNSVTSIGDNAFRDCTSLTSITIPNSVTEIGDYAFSGCSSLTSITIPNGVTSIGGGAFYGTPWLENQSDGCVYINNCLYTYKEEMSANTHVDVKEGTTRICDYAFSGCSSLTSITIPNSVTSIGSSAFEGCLSLTSITIPNSVTSIGEYTFSGCSSLTSIIIPNSVTSIEWQAFSGCSSLTLITIPNSVTSIGRSAFYGCSSLTSITIPNSVTSIGYRAFFGCPSLASVAIGNSVIEIGSDAFSNCSSLTSITIPNSVTAIGDYAFYGCSALTSVQWNAKKCSDFGYRSPFNGCKQITSFTFGDNVEHIPAYLCYGMSKLTSITIPNSVTSIGRSAFEGCSSLTSITIPNSVTSIGYGAFDGCQSLTSITIQVENPLTINEYTFKNVSRSVSIKVPCGSKAKYQTAQYWKEFINYEEVPAGTLTVDVNDKTMGFATITKQNNCTDDVAQVQAQALVGYEFVRWSDGATENPHILLVTEDMTITAEFRKIGEEPEDKPGEEEKHNNFIVESADKTQGAVEITITAKAIEGFEFDHWSDGSTENPRVVTLDEDVELYAYFRVAAGTGLENSVISSVNVYGSNGILYVEGVETDYHVLDAVGRLIYSGHDARLHLPRGVYVIAVGGEVQKVVI